MEKYSEWYSQFGAKTSALSASGSVLGPTVEVRQNSFEELLDQDQQLEEYFKTGPANEWNMQRGAFKSSFRGTRLYRMRNQDRGYNAKHLNQLSDGAKAFKALYPKQKIDKSIVDHDAVD